MKREVERGRDSRKESKEGHNTCLQYLSMTHIPKRPDTPLRPGRHERRGALPHTAMAHSHFHSKAQARLLLGGGGDLSTL